MNQNLTFDTTTTTTTAAASTTTEADVVVVTASSNDDDNNNNNTSNDVVQVVYERTMGYIDEIKKCYELQQQITGDDIMTLLESKHSNSSNRLQCLRGKVRDRYFITPLQQQQQPVGGTNNNNSNSNDAADSSAIRTENHNNNNSNNNKNTNSNKVILITTDRQSGFDRNLAIVPYKGAVLNLCSAYWFTQTQDIIKNHIISIPHPNITIAQQYVPFPIEFVVRAYLTGSTSTSIWKNYNNGVRNYCGHILPDGMNKNQKLSHILLTPTTKEEYHDRPISLNEIIHENWMTPDDLDVCSTAAIQLFQRGQEIAIQRGLILVDTKYEFGYHPITKEIVLIDEIHTPDSSRYWIASTYEERYQKQLEPENIDKEFLRLWFIQQPNCDPYNTTIPLPIPPIDLIIELSRRYIQLYEMITGQIFDFTSNDTGLVGCTTDNNNNNNDTLMAKIIEETFFG